MRIYQSTDASAPTLQGVVGGTYSSGWADGSLLNLLDKVLVAGYGSKTAAGWTRSFTGTSKGVFRQGAGCQFYFRVLDDGSLTAGAREAQFYGGETASDVDTLTGQFPRSSDQATYLKFRKSNKADSTQRSWLCFADNRTCIVFSWSQQGDSGVDYLSSMYIGDFHSFVSGDAYNCCAWGRTTSATLDTPSTNELAFRMALMSSVWSGGMAGLYMARPYSQAGVTVNPVIVAYMFEIVSAGTLVPGSLTYSSQTIIPFPNPTDGKCVVCRYYLVDSTTAPVSGLRGYLRGAWSIQHSYQHVPKNFYFDGVGTLAGKTLWTPGLPVSGSPGVFVMETSDTWD